MRMPLALLTVLTVSACGGITASPRVGPGNPGPVPDPGGVTRPEPIDAASGFSDLRRACRASVAPRGWIAVEYLQGERCPEWKSYDGYTGVLLQRFDNRPRGTVLIVCADEPTPSGWVREDAPPESRCPGARVREGEPTAHALRRFR